MEDGVHLLKMYIFPESDLVTLLSHIAYKNSATQHNTSFACIYDYVGLEEQQMRGKENSKKSLIRIRKNQTKTPQSNHHMKHHSVNFQQLKKQNTEHELQCHSQI